MEQIQAIIAARSEPEGLHNLIRGYEKMGVRSQLGFLCTYYNSFSRAFQIADLDRDKDLIKSLEQRGYIMMDWGQYRRAESLAQVPNRGDLFLSLRSRAKEMRRDIDWLEASFERLDRFGESLRLPPTGAFLQAELHGLPWFEEMQRAFQQTKSWGD